MQVKDAWRELHKQGLNCIPVGHYLIPRLIIDAQTFPDTRQRLAAILNCPEDEVVSALRSYLKIPTFAETLRDFIVKLRGNRQVAGRGSAIPSLASVTNIRTASSKNSYQPFYEQRISDETAERMIEVYAPIASGIAILLGQVSNLMALDFDNEEALLRFLQDMGFSADEENIEEILQIAFPDNPIVRTYRGYHVWSAYDAEIVKILGGKSYEEGVGGYEGFEIRCHHSYIVVPPSACGVANGVIKRYEFIRPLDKSNRNAQLPAWFYFWLKETYKPKQQTQTMLSVAPTSASSVKDIIVNALTPYWQKGHRQDLCYALSGVMRRVAIPLSEAREIIQTICEMAGDEEIKHRLYTVEYEYRLPTEGEQCCAGAKAFKENAAKAGVPSEVVQTIINALYGIRMTTNLESTLKDHNILGKRAAARLQNNFCFNRRYNAWFRFNFEKLEWVKLDDKEMLVYAYEASKKVRDDHYEVAKINYNDSIPPKILGMLNRLLDQNFVRNTIMGVIRTELTVDHEFPRIPNEYIPKEYQHLQLCRVTFHRNGCLLWFDRGETYFIPNTETFITQREFYATQTLPSEVKEDADMSPFVNYVAEVMGGKDNAEYFLKIASTVLAKKTNPYRKTIIFVGKGSNGKNSTLDILKAALGDLVQQTNSSAIIKSDGVLNLASIHKLRGSAIAFIDETPDKRWNTDILKEITGSKSIVAKDYYRKPEDMEITFILLILTNHLPEAFEKQCAGLADRLAIIRFPFRYADVPFETKYIKKRDPSKVEKVKENPAAIIQALRYYYKVAAQENYNHPIPTDILKATQDIQMRANSVDFFLQYCVEDDPYSSVSVNDMFKVYRDWCDYFEVKGVKKGEFRQQLENSNFKIERTKQGLICHCVRLNTEFLNNNNNNEPAPTPSLLSSDSQKGDDGQPPEDDEQDYLDQFPF